MALPSPEYWRQRSEARMDTYLRDSAGTMQLISQAHAKAQADIQAEIDRLYARYEKTYRLDPVKARELLQQPADQAEYERLRQAIAGIKNADRRRPLAAQASSGAYAYRINRLEALKLNVRAQMGKLSEAQLGAVTKGLTGTIKQAYQTSIFDVQKGTGRGLSFSQLSDQAIAEILHNPWSGTSFSKRIWQNQQQIAQIISRDITAGFASGRSVAQMSAELAANMQTSYNNAERLVRTETNYMANAAEMRSYEECGIDKYEYMATLDNHTSEICQDLDGQVFLVKDAKAGKNMPPMHPRCRSTTVAALTSENDDALERRARDPVTGKPVLVPQSMKYMEWQKLQDDTYGPERVSLAHKMVENEGSDRAQFARYKERLSKETPGTFSAFQSMKYGDAESWGTLENKYSNWLYEQDFGGIIEMQATLPDQTVRRWYKHHAESIPDRIDISKPVEDQAKQAHALRNQFRTEARLLMADRESAAQLDITDPNLTFDELIAKKIHDPKKPDITTREQAIQDIIKTATKTNKGVNQKLGIE